MTELLSRLGCSGTMVEAGIGCMGGGGTCVYIGLRRQWGQRDIGCEMAGNDRSGGTDGHRRKRTGDLARQRSPENTASGEPHHFADEVAERPGSRAASGLSSIGVDLPRPLPMSTLQRGELQAFHHEATRKGP